MSNLLFRPDILALLTDPGRWELHARVGPSSPSSPNSIANRDHLQWSRAHSHAHSHRELLFALSGETFVGFNENLIPCNPGSVFFFDAGEKHDNGYPSGSPELEHLWFGFASGHVFVRRVAVRNGKLSSERVADFPMDCPNQIDLSAPSSILWGECKPIPERRRLKMFLAVVQLVSSLLDEAISAEPERNKTQESQKNALIAKIRRHIESCGGVGVNLDSLSRLSGYSKYHFHRIFAAISGKSPKEFIDHCRMQNVRSMEEEHRTQKEIAFDLGFSSPSAFSRWRRRMAQIDSGSDAMRGED
jgi:AraC-like DNA-binding protein